MDTLEITPKTRKENEVWQACQSLIDEGMDATQLTGLAIGDTLLELGYNRGSNSDIHRYKKTWLKANGYEALINEETRTTVFTNTFAATEVKHLQAKLDTLQDKYDTCLVEKIQYENQVLILDGRCNDMLEQLKQGFNDLKQANDKTLHYMEEQSNQRIQAFQQAQEQLKDQLATANTQNRRDREQTDQTSSQLKLTLSEIESQHAQQCTTLEHEYQVKLKSCEEDYLLACEEHTELETQIKLLTQQLEQSQTDHFTTEERYERLTQEKQALEQHCQSLEERLNANENDLSLSKARNDMQKQQLARIHKLLSGARDDANALKVLITA